MSKLNFASINEAFLLGSDQIKNTQEEITKLKALVLESSGISQQQFVTGPKPVTPPPAPAPPPPKEYNPDKSEDDFDYAFLKLMKHPKFDDIVKNYVSVKYPNMNNKNLISTESKEGFGQKYTRTICSDIRNYIVFFIISLVIYLFLSLYLRPRQS